MCTTLTGACNMRAMSSASASVRAAEASDSSTPTTIGSVSPAFLATGVARSRPGTQPDGRSARHGHRGHGARPRPCPPRPGGRTARRGREPTRRTLHRHDADLEIRMRRAQRLPAAAVSAASPVPVARPAGASTSAKCQSSLGIACMSANEDHVGRRSLRPTGHRPGLSRIRRFPRRRGPVGCGAHTPNPMRQGANPACISHTRTSAADVAVSRWPPAPLILAASPAPDPRHPPDSARPGH